MSNQNELAKSPQRRQLVKIDDLYNDIELAGKQNELNRLLNCEPKKEWVKQHEGRNYIPIGIIEYLLIAIYLKYRVEVKDVKQMVNAVVVTVRLHVQDPITGEWDWNDGIGAQDIKTAKGKTPMDFEHIIYGAVMTGAPAAESYAIKDAAEKFGKIFGKDLNRKDENTMNYEGLAKKLTPDEIPQEIKDFIEMQIDIDELDKLYDGTPQLHANSDFFRLISARKQTIKAKTA
jgi:hypothetical protein